MCDLEPSGPSERAVEAIMDAQADLQSGLGHYRLDHGRGTPIENWLSRSLARLHAVLDACGHPMYDAATHPEVPAIDHPPSPPGGDEVEALTPEEAEAAADYIENSERTVWNVPMDRVESAVAKLRRLSLSPPQTTEGEK